MNPRNFNRVAQPIAVAPDTHPACGANIHQHDPAAATNAVGTITYGRRVDRLERNRIDWQTSLGVIRVRRRRDAQPATRVVLDIHTLTWLEVCKVHSPAAEERILISCATNADVPDIAARACCNRRPASIE